MPHHVHEKIRRPLWIIISGSGAFFDMTRKMSVVKKMAGSKCLKSSMTVSVIDYFSMKTDFVSTENNSFKIFEYCQ